MIIKNFAEIATNQLRANALKIIEAGLAAVDTEKVIHNFVKLYKENLLLVKDNWFDLSRYRRIYLVGIGKSAFAACKSLEEIFGEKITDGVVLDTRGGKLKKVRSLVGSHPLATRANITATNEIISLLKSADEEDLILAIVSGGGSALLCLPHRLSCEEQNKLVEVLVRKGAGVEEINTVRKHLSEIKGGNFARLAFPAKLVALIFSDVPGDDISLVASGPTVLDTTTVADARRIMAKYAVLESCRLPHCELVETPKDPVYFQLVSNIVVANNQLAIEAMEKEAKKLNYRPEIFSYNLEGEAEEAAKRLVLNAKPATALLAAGETTVSLNGRGLGGRNQHLVLSALNYLRKGQVIISVDSDGLDNSLFAGAIGDSFTLEKAKKQGLVGEKFLKDFDSANFFQLVNDGIKTGPLNSDIADFMLVLSK